MSRKSCIYRYRGRLSGEARGREVVVSLGTRRYREAEHRAALLDRVFDDALVRARQAVTEVGGKADVNAILRDYLREVLDRDLARRMDRQPGRPVYAHWWEPGDPGTATDADLKAIRDARASLVRDLASGSFDMSAEADAIMRRHGLPEHLRRPLELGLCEAAIRAWEVAERRTLGTEPLVIAEAPAGNIGPISPHHPTPEMPATTEVQPTAPEAPASVPLASELVGPFLDHQCPDDPEAGVRNQTRHQTDASVRLFTKAMGDRPITAYGPADGLDYLALLRQLPGDHHKLGRGDDERSIAEVIERGRREGKKPLALRSLQRHGQVLTSFMEFAYRRGLVEARMREITDGWRLPKKKVAAHAERRAWNDDQLNALFALPIWRGCKSRTRRLEPGTLILRDWKFWLPILGLYQGARLEELCQLRREDVCRDPKSGLYYFDINDRDGRQLKNAQSARLLPLHPEVVRLGFVRDVLAATGKPSDRVFPDLKPIGPDKKLSYYPTRWFGYVQKACGVGSDVDFHSFRHTANSRLLNAGVPPFVVARLLGRIYEAGGETTNRYFEGEMRALHDALSRLSYPELNLSHLHVQDAPGARDCQEFRVGAVRCR